MNVTELVEKLEGIEVSTDADVVIFNDGCFYEWYGVEDLTNDKIIVKPKCIYILLGSIGYEQEHVNLHYEKNYNQ